MPFPALIALGLTAKEDSQYFTDAPIDGSIKYETEGGLIVTRRRFTRNAGRHIVTGYSFMSQADKTILDRFFVSMGGGAMTFAYNHPTTGESLTVRFESEYKTIYKGIGSNFMWEVTDIKLRST